MVVDVLVTVICVKIFNFGIIALTIGMIGALLFVIAMSELWFFKSFNQNLFAKIKNPVKSILEIFSTGSAASLGKFYSLFIVFFFNPEVVLSLYDFAVESFKTYSLSVIFAAINSIFIITYMVENHKFFANVMEIFTFTLGMNNLYLRFNF